jgi:hypothetical protein
MAVRAFGAALGGESNMFGNILRVRAPRLAAGNENAAPRLLHAEAPETQPNVRALATGAALATSVDNSPAVLVSIYDYAHRYRDKDRRSA